VISTRTNKGAAQGRCTRHLARTMRSLSIDAVGDLTSALFPVGPESLHSSKTLSIGGLRMAQDFTHAPVLLDEVVELFAPVPTGVVIDATLGGAGHAGAILRSRPDLGLIGVDRDKAALEVAAGRLEAFGTRAVVVGGRFSSISDVIRNGLDATGPWPNVPGIQHPAPVVGILADLGVSSPQLDVAERGFSFAKDGPLDMRMDPSSGVPASTYLNQVDLDELTRVLRENGEGRYARRIARSILEALPIETTSRLAAVVDRAVPKADRRKGHVASRVFQGLRIAVNAELEELETLLDASHSELSPGGRLVVISYHSGEDARVKRAMRVWADGDCSCPDSMPCVCGAISVGTLVARKAIVASLEEIDRNPRARSARLRGFEAAS